MDTSILTVAENSTTHFMASPEHCTILLSYRISAGVSRIESLQLSGRIDFCSMGPIHVPCTSRVLVVLSIPCWTCRSLNVYVHLLSNSMHGLALVKLLYSCLKSIWVASRSIWMQKRRILNAALFTFMRGSVRQSVFLYMQLSDGSCSGFPCKLPCHDICPCTHIL